MESRSHFVVVTVLILTLGHTAHAIYEDIFIHKDYILDDENSPDSIHVYGDATVNMYGGEIVESGLNDRSRFNLFGGNVHSLYLRDSSSALILGGSINLRLKEQSTADIHRGNVISLYCAPESTAFLHAYDVVYDPLPRIESHGIVEGKYLLDDSPFTIELLTSQTYERIHIVPEPATMVLMLSAGILTLRSRDRRNQ